METYCCHYPVTLARPYSNKSLQQETMKNWHSAAELEGQACSLYLRTAATDVGFSVSLCLRSCCLPLPSPVFFPRAPCHTPSYT